jgi:hypothetical protein
MGNFASKYGVSTNSFEILEAGRYTLTLSEIVETVGKKYQSEEEEVRLKWKFQTAEERNSDGEPYTVFYFTKCIYTTHEKNKLGKVIKGLYGKALSIEEFNKIDSDELIGKKVDVLVENNERPDGRTFTNITSFLGPPKKKKLTAVSNANIFKSAQQKQAAMEKAEQEKYTAGEEEMKIMEDLAKMDVEEIDFDDVPF